MTNIRHVRSSMLSGSMAGFFSLPSSLLTVVALIPMSTSGQSTAATPSLTSHSRAELTRSMTRSFISSTVSNSSATPATSTSSSISNDILPGSTRTEDANQGAFKYYWLILAIFGLFVTLFLWWINRRRIKRKERMRLSARNALAQDMEGWIDTRRWYHGAWRPNQTGTFIRRDEGLNEHGEAPPPYRPKGEVTITQDPATGLSIPLSTLSREHIDAGRPPEYRETANRVREYPARPDTAGSHTNRSVTSGPRPTAQIVHEESHT
jgi:hypothetical protein